VFRRQRTDFLITDFCFISVRQPRGWSTLYTLAHWTLVIIKETATFLILFIPKWPNKWIVYFQACAHRYKKTGSSFVWGQGICFSLSNTLEELDALEPCSGKPTTKAHEQYGFCQAGTSVAFHKVTRVIKAFI